MTSSSHLTCQVWPPWLELARWAAENVSEYVAPGSKPPNRLTDGTRSLQEGGLSALWDRGRIFEVNALPLPVMPEPLPSDKGVKLQPSASGGCMRSH